MTAFADVDPDLGPIVPEDSGAGLLLWSGRPPGQPATMR